MQTAFGKLTSKNSQAPKPIYIFIESEKRISVYSGPPPFSLNNLVGYIGDGRRLARTKRGFLFSTFELSFGDGEDEKIQYMTDNKFGDLLNLFI